MNYFFSATGKLTLLCFFLFFTEIVVAQDGTQPTVPAVVIRTIPDSAVTKMQKSDDFRYANDSAYWQKEKPADTSGIDRMLSWLSRTGLLKGILYFLLGAIVLFILYQVFSVNGFKLFSPRKKRIKTEETFSAEEAENIDGLITDAITHGKFREATRYLYLKTLQVLNAKDFISIQAKATNNDYVLQMAKSSKSRDFGHLTNMYEYVWYGEFQPNDQQFSIINNQFDKFISQV